MGTSVSLAEGMAVELNGGISLGFAVGPSNGLSLGRAVGVDVGPGRSAVGKVLGCEVGPPLADVGATEPLEHWDDQGLEVCPERYWN